jgi:hypothetical protein
VAGRRGDAVGLEGGGERLGATNEVLRLGRGEAAGGELGEGAVEIGLERVLDGEQLDGCLDRHRSRSFGVCFDMSLGVASAGMIARTASRYHENLHSEVFIL